VSPVDSGAPASSGTAVGVAGPPQAPATSASSTSSVPQRRRRDCARAASGYGEGVVGSVGGRRNRMPVMSRPPVRARPDGGACFDGAAGADTGEPGDAPRPRWGTLTAAQRTSTRSPGARSTAWPSRPRPVPHPSACSAPSRDDRAALPGPRHGPRQPRRRSRPARLRPSPTGLEVPAASSVAILAPGGPAADSRADREVASGSRASSSRADRWPGTPRCWRVSLPFGASRWRSIGRWHSESTRSGSWRRRSCSRRSGSRGLQSRCRSSWWPPTRSTSRPPGWLDALCLAARLTPEARGQMNRSRRAMMAARASAVR
jgi:hypothetical protein